MSDCALVDGGEVEGGERERKWNVMVCESKNKGGFSDVDGSVVRSI